MAWPYTYADNDPLTKIDPTGEFAFVVPAAVWAGEAIASWLLPAAAGTAVAAIMVTPGDKDLQQAIEKEANRREYKNICNEPPPPGLDQCELAKWNLRKAQMCKDARDANTNKWWGGADNQHSSQLAQDLSNAIRNAQAAVERACQCRK